MQLVGGYSSKIRHRNHGKGSQESMNNKDLAVENFRRKWKANFGWIR
jgi:hypothetical protein